MVHPKDALEIAECARDMGGLGVFESERRQILHGFAPGICRTEFHS